MRKLGPVLFFLSLSACQTPVAPGSSPEPSPSSSASVIPSTTIPDFVPRGNQRLASGEHLGLGFVLNQLDAQGNGAVIWSLGDPTGQRFSAFKASDPIALGRFQTERLTWSLDSQGNGQVFRQQFGGPNTNLLSDKTDVYIYNVVNFLPQPEPVILSDTSLLNLQKDLAGNGWLLTQAKPPSETRPLGSHSAQPVQAHRLHNYRLVSGETHFLPAELLNAGFLLDAEGNGFAIRRETQTPPKTALWLQRLERFGTVGAPEQLTDNSDTWQVSEQNGQGLVFWPVQDEQRRPIRYELLQISNYRPGSRLPSIPLNQGDVRPHKSLVLNPQGDGALLWQETNEQPGNNDPLTSHFMQAVKAYQPGQSKLLFSSGDETFSSLDLQLGPDGRGLAIWRQQPWAASVESLPNQGQRLMVRPLENFLPADEPMLLSESTQKSVEEVSLKLSPEGHGLITWIQYQPCEQATCPLVRTVWARAVYGFRIP